MIGCEVVFHAAGMNASCLPDPSPLFRVNVEGTRNVLEAAARAGVRRFVHTSSAAAIGEPAGTIGREDTAHRGWFLTAYERSKFEAERLVLDRGPELGARGGLRGPGVGAGARPCRGHGPAPARRGQGPAAPGRRRLALVRRHRRLRPRSCAGGRARPPRRALHPVRGIHPGPPGPPVAPGRDGPALQDLVRPRPRGPAGGGRSGGGGPGGRADPTGLPRGRQGWAPRTPVRRFAGHARARARLRAAGGDPRRTVAWFAAQGLLREGPPRAAAEPPAMGSAYDGDLEAEPTKPHTRTRRWRSP